MTEFKDIDLKDKEIFDRIFEKSDPTVSEFTFTNFFMWKHYYNYRFTVVGGYLCVYAKPMHEAPFMLIPAGSGNEKDFENAVVFLCDFFKKNNWGPVFKKVPERDLCRLISVTGENSKVEYDRDNSDYVYLTSDLIGLKGKSYHGKRNHISRFNKEYKFEYEEITQENINECREIMDRWCAERNCDCMRGEYCEKYANLSVLDNYFELGCKGALIKVNNIYRAFTIGEMLNGDTAVIHIEKADFKINGLYALINREFCARQWNETVYINREQDLGQEGLRKAKESYYPDHMSNKFILHLR